VSDDGEDTRRKHSRRTFLRNVTGAAVSLGVGLPADAVAALPAPAAGFWWRRFTSFIQLGPLDAFGKSGARMVIFGCSSDPTWGPFAQRLTILDNAAGLRRLKMEGARVITWIEGFGDCMIYAVTVERRPDGSFVTRRDDPRVTQVMRSHWSWTNTAIPQGNTFRWVGLHNTIDNEDFVGPSFWRKAIGIPVPAYPDGRPAIGLLPGKNEPLNARIYDACGAKDINGNLRPAFEPPAGVNTIDPATGRPHGPTEGLWPAAAGEDDVPVLPGLNPGDLVYCGVISVHKDLSAPFWQEYARESVRQIAKQGVDGVWCDNYSPWDNFGYPPVQKAFGDWSVDRFHRFVQSEAGLREELKPGANFDIREHLKATAVRFGAKDPAKYDDPTWRDVRWLDDPAWNAFKAFRQRRAQTDLSGFYRAIHEETARAGRADFCINGNDIPFFGLGWTRDTWLDMVNTELTPGWHMGTGSRGIMIPPVGKMAPVYRAGREHQKGPYMAAWYYLNGPYEKHQRKPGIARVLMAEAFANGAFLLCDPGNKSVAGTVESHGDWNRFLSKHENWFGNRGPITTAGVLFSPDNQLALMTPGGFPNMDRQPHIFGYYGWATALTDAHVPYRAVTDWKLNAEHLHGLSLFIVPSAECLTPEAAHDLEAWVRAGGRLIVTGRSGVRSGPEGYFRRRAHSTLAALIGADPDATDAPVKRTVGRGSVHWTPGELGMDYYLASTAQGRSVLLPQLREFMAPAGGLLSPMIDPLDLPATVGIAAWRSRAADALYVDMVNYDLDPDTDQIHPAQNAMLRIHTGWAGVHAETAAPDAGPAATCELKSGWAVIDLPTLTHYASVKLVRA